MFSVRLGKPPLRPQLQPEKDVLEQVDNRPKVLLRLRVVKIFDTGSFEIIDGICSVVAQGKYRWPLLCHCLLGKSVLRSGANLSWTVPFPLYLYIGNGNGAARTIQRPSVFVNDRIRYRAHSQSLDIIRKACFPDPPKSQ